MIQKKEGLILKNKFKILKYKLIILLTYIPFIGKYYCNKKYGYIVDLYGA